MAEAAGVTQKALDFTGTNVDAFKDRISKLQETFTNYGADFEQI